ncbi:hypothetical protein [Streptomyces sp. WM6378]|uniref:hypothetical protein n=1 Tax=Streptomyces sp. WM6378 TaxID=1415557 RepID=UPI0006AFB559|nr:hypothetical protein [Streptomyces sp. WM6378]KOU38155.1 hypothetical protein ADK54_29840 [Streptomyces sp. WM6378]
MNANITKQVVGSLGWVVGIQGALGFAGGLFGNGPWGFLHKIADIPPGGYLALLALGAVPAVWAEMGKRPRREAS